LFDLTETGITRVVAFPGEIEMVGNSPGNSREFPGERGNSGKYNKNLNPHV